MLPKYTIYGQQRKVSARPSPRDNPHRELLSASMPYSQRSYAWEIEDAMAEQVPQMGTAQDYRAGDLLPLGSPAYRKEARDAVQRARANEVKQFSSYANGLENDVAAADGGTFAEDTTPTPTVFREENENEYEYQDLDFLAQMQN